MNSEGSRRKPDTPVCDFVRNYREQGWLRLHMPGHKGRGALEALDITEIRGAEPLYSGGGILRESEEIAAELFGADRTVYSAEGSSLCIHAMLFLAKMRAEQRGEKALILAGRNAHRSFLSAAALLGLEVAWLRGENLLTCCPDGITLERALAGLKEKPAAVYLTSPDYLGNRADISALSRVCRSRGIPLLVDNAHGAYLRFLPRDEHPLTLGADLTCDSAHKTLPVLTGGAYLHISREADPFWRGQADRAMALFASTSPSWLILQSLDRCNAELRNGYREKLDRRNALICSRYSAGQSVLEIAEEFFLSPETIKKLVYGKKTDLPMFSPSVSSAGQYAAAGMGEEWVRAYLDSLGKTAPDITEYFMSELVRIPLRLIEEDVSGTPGVESQFAFDVPLIVVYDHRVFSVPFQPGYLRSLKAEKKNAHYAFIFAKNEEYVFFWNNFGKNFRR